MHQRVDWQVAGKTIPESRDAIIEAVSQDVESPKIYVDVYAYNSKVYYIVSKGQDTGGSVVRCPITGNETVLDGIFAGVGNSKD